MLLDVLIDSDSELRMEDCSGKGTHVPFWRNWVIVVVKYNYLSGNILRHFWVN